MTSSAIPLAGRHALVTGGARGIGLACAQALLRRGAALTLLGRDRAALDAAGADLGKQRAGRPAGADIADEGSGGAAVLSAAREAGPVDTLVNNAGEAVSQRFDRTDAALWQAMLAVNLTGTYHCIQAALPAMLASGGGRIINVASTAGLTGYPYVSAYCAAK